MHKFIETHQKGIRLALVVTGSIAAVSTPFLAAAAKEKAAKKIAETGATTKREKLAILVKEPLVWAAAGTTIASLGCGLTGYGIADRMILKSKKIIDKTLDDLETVETVISNMPEKEKTEIHKKVVDQKFEKAMVKADKALEDGERCLGNAAIPVDTGYGNTLFYDCWTGTCFLSSYQKIISVMNELNEEINDGSVMKTVADWATKNGWQPKELDYDYIFTKNIKLLKDNDHFYDHDDKGNPVGMIEFTFDTKPKHFSKKEQEGLPWI